MWLRILRFVALATAATLCASSPAVSQGPGNTWVFQRVLTYNKLNPLVAVNGAPVVTTGGGHVNLTADGNLNGPPRYCPKGFEPMQFTWVFTRDVKTLTDGDVVQARITGHLGKPVPPCTGGIAVYSMIGMAHSNGASSPLPADLQAQVDSERTVRAATPNYAYANQPPQATDAAIAFERAPAKPNADLAWFAFDIGVRSGGDFWVVYLYKRVPTGQPPQPQPPTPTPAPAPGGGFTSQLNVDHRGGDYANFDLPTADPNLCQAACAKDPQCVGYTYVNPYAGKPAHCWLKNVLTPGVPSSCCISGVRTKAGAPGRGITTEPGVDRPGSDYSQFDLPQADAGICRADCANDVNCKAYTYVRPGVQGPNARCYLKNAVPPQRPSNCCTSGVKQ